MFCLFILTIWDISHIMILEKAKEKMKMPVISRFHGIVIKMWETQEFSKLEPIE